MSDLSPAPTPARARLLVVDDEPAVREILRRALEQEGYAVVVAANGEEAVERMKEHYFHAVLTDLIMPRKDGIQAMLELRSVDPHVPVIAMSGGAMDGGGDFLPLARQLGARAVLSKPFPYDTLMSAVKGALAAGPSAAVPLAV